MSLFKLNLYVPLFTTLMLNVTEVSAQQTNDPFEQLEQEMAALEKEGSAEELKEFNDWKETYLSEYQDFRRKHFKNLMIYATNSLTRGVKQILCFLVKRPTIALITKQKPLLTMRMTR